MRPYYTYLFIAVLVPLFVLILSNVQALEELALQHQKLSYLPKVSLINIDL